MKRRDFLGSLAAAGLAAQSASAADNADRPNIIFILADDLGYGDLGCYGQRRIDTANIDRLAAEGMRFTQAYAGSTVCAPSRSCLMTGTHTGHTRIRGNSSPVFGRVPLRPDDVTVAEVLKQAGYRTAIIGKWGLGEPMTSGTPNRQGFDEWFGYLNQGHAHDYYPQRLWKNEEELFLRGNLGGYKEEYSHDVFVERALEFIGSAGGGDGEHPFFLYLPLTIPHANNELGRDTGDGMEVPDYGDYATEPWPSPEKGFAAMITRMDRDIGRIMDRLKRLGLDERTIVFFTSDNGPHSEGGHDPEFFQSRGPLRGIKRDLYEGGVRVPTIARWPGKIEPGQVTDELFAFWDLLPTAAELAGVEPPGGIDGISIVPTLLGQEQPGREYLYWEFSLGRRFLQAARTDDWKGVRNGLDEPIEIYNLADDLGETNDVAKEHPEVVRRIERIFSEAHSDSEAFPIPSSG